MPSCPIKWTQGLFVCDRAENYKQASRIKENLLCLRQYENILSHYLAHCFMSLEINTCKIKYILAQLTNLKNVLTDSIYVCKLHRKIKASYYTGILLLNYEIRYIFKSVNIFVFCCYLSFYLCCISSKTSNHVLYF